MAGATCTSLAIFFLTLVFSLPLAVIVAKGRMSKHKAISWITKVYIMIMRGTPLLLQLLFFYFAPYYIFGKTYDRFVAVIVAFVINYAAYFAEIFRGGFNSIPVGQFEASKVLGFSKSHTFFSVICPQVVKRVLPATANEVITLVKDTALANTLGVMELFRVAQTASSRMFSVVPIFIAGVFYFVMNYIVFYVFSFAEKKLNYYKI